MKLISFLTAAVLLRVSALSTSRANLLESITFSIGGLDALICRAIQFLSFVIILVCVISYSLTGYN